MRSVLATLGAAGLPRLVGPLVRTGLLRLGSVTGRDPLRRATIRDRYGSPDSWLRFWDELAGSWLLAEELQRRLRDVVRLPSTLQLVAGGSRTAQLGERWLKGQRRLSEQLGSELEVLPDAAHLVHLDRPDAIAAAITARPGPG